MTNLTVLTAAFGTLATATQAALAAMSARTLSPIVNVRAGGAVSNSADSLAAGAALVAAVAALPTAYPNPGGVLQLGRGFYTLAASGVGSQLDLRRPSVKLVGIGDVSGGAAPGTVIETYNGGSGSILLFNDATSVTLRDMMVRGQNAAFSGRLCDAEGVTQTDHVYLQNVILWLAPGSTGTLWYANRSIEQYFDRVTFEGGNYAVVGRRTFAITAVSVANPTVITAPAHGVKSGDGIRIGGVSTTPTLLYPDGWTATVLDANHFTIPVNVTAVAVGTGGGHDVSRDFQNVMTFDKCVFINQIKMPIWNPGHSWKFNNPAVQALASGHAGFIGHDPGNYSRALSVDCGWMGDVTASGGSLETWMTISGAGFSCRSAFISGNQQCVTTVVRFDDEGCEGWEFAAHSMSNVKYDIDFGTVPAPHGLYAANAHNNVIGGWAAFTGTIPPGTATGDPAKPTRPSMFVSW